MILIFAVVALIVNGIYVIANLIEGDTFWTIMAFVGVLLSGFVVFSEVTE